MRSDAAKIAQILQPDCQTTIMRKVIASARDHPEHRMHCAKAVSKPIVHRLRPLAVQHRSWSRP